MPVTRYRYRGSTIPAPWAPSRSQRLASPSGRDTWIARCGENRTPGAAGGPGKPTRSNPGRAPRSDPTNLAEAVERAVARHRSCLQEQPPQAEPGPGTAEATPAPEGLLAARTRARHAEICDAIACGLTITEISRTLRLDRKTVRRYASAATPDQLVPDARLARPGLLGPHLTYLHQRWDEGCRSTEKLNEELRARGYRGSLRTLRRHTARLRQDTAPPAPPPAPAAKKVASRILTPPAKLTDDHRAALAQITARCEELTTTRTLVREFADMLCHRHGEHLETWASQAESSPVSELRGFAKGLRKDWAAVTAVLTLPYSSGVVEGHVNRIKMIKRQMYGRAKPDLLRKRVLLAD